MYYYFFYVINQNCINYGNNVKKKINTSVIYPGNFSSLIIIRVLMDKLGDEKIDYCSAPSLNSTDRR